ncbi:MAG: hypothetical protein L0I80_04380 [Brevibacterium sp.]|uniref:hypothetical protein n=1 Tax=Brevibacterium sp. TaxID=1701 RepID=UPI002648ABCE|nr:hypothetical protein [Brevibacterium sp.]MDN5806072.1 hypothetical protein [Brevibacterium sp.]MDN5876954.1 hypothetical protein [Brevibacterium sp.]MDN5909121.1 hypothetical protein [Brevibacterium sp.]MDN6123094.1 hypothetical protein [Brevibacterium sp.]MDN6156453.1 hypothetical protein [Brevibacterium sp.]
MLVLELVLMLVLMLLMLLLDIVVRHRVRASVSVVFTKEAELSAADPVNQSMRKNR